MPYRDPKDHLKLKARLHRERHANAIAQLGGKCTYCGSTENLQLDHIDPGTKTCEISKSLMALGKYLEELKKCQVLCKPCHMKKSAKEKSKPMVHGTLNGYRKKGCRCDLCRAANRTRYQAKKLKALNPPT